MRRGGVLKPVKWHFTPDRFDLAKQQPQPFYKNRPDSVFCQGDFYAKLYGV